MSTIITIEDALIAEAKTVLGNKVREVDSLAGEFDTETLRRLVRNVPGVYWSFLGGQPLPDDYELRVRGQWALYIVTDHASGQAARRRGDGRAAGAYELLGLLAPHFNNFTITGVGTLTVSRMQNLFNGTLEKQGVAVYAVSFNLPMTLVQPADDALDDFVTFDADYDVEPFEDSAEHDKWLEEPPDHATSKPDVEQTITLDQ